MASTIPARAPSSRSPATPLAIDGLALAGALLLGALCVALHLALQDYAFDDAYIHFRIASRLAREGVPYYNTGEAVMASTAPAWTLLLAPLFLVQEDPRRLVALANALFTTAGACASIALLRELGAGALRRPLLWSLAIPYLSIVLPASLGLMETALALLLLQGALLLVLRGCASGFALLGVAPFLRPELAVFSAALVAREIARAPARAARVLAACALGALPLVAYELYFFGTLIPSGVVAKARVYALSGAEVLAVVLAGISPPLPQVSGWLAVALFLAGLALLVRSLARRAARGPADAAERDSLGLLLCGIAVAAAYVVARAFVFPWYVPLFAWPLTLAFCAILARDSPRGAAVAILALVVVPHALRLEPVLAAAFDDPLAHPIFAENARARQYIEVGRRLGRRHPGARLLSSEIGGLGYGFPGRILDGVGLVSPEALRHHPMAVPAERSHGGVGAIPVEFVRETRPELIVSLDVFVEAFERSDVRRDYLRQEEPIYAEEDRRLAGLWNSRALNVFVRRDLAGAPGAGARAEPGSP